MSPATAMRQWAPYPWALDEIVKQLQVLPGWEFKLLDEERDPADTHSGSAGGLTFEVIVTSADPYRLRPCETCRQPYPNSATRFLYPVPPATYDRQTWLDWVGDCIESTALHEIREAVHLDDGERPFAPNHGPGRDPYRRYSYATDEHRRTSFRGVVKPSVEEA